jgi:3-oxosteroid 1-dehydrogenase
VTHILSGQTLEELAAAIEKRLAEIADRTAAGSRILLVSETSDRGVQQFAETGVDLDFHRGEAPIEKAKFGNRRPGNDKPNMMMYPIRQTGPYYAVMTGGGTLDTKGGPKINGAAQVLKLKDKWIPGLYGAGNCIAPPAGPGLLGRRIDAECRADFGAIAGKQAPAAASNELG